MVPISFLNDFLFCPYSIYLHGIYSGTDNDLYKAAPQIKGTLMHRTVDDGMIRGEGIMTARPVYSEEYDLWGVIDMLDTVNGILTERKSRCTIVYPGQRFQLWGQYVCLREMRFEVSRLQIQDLYSGRLFPVNIPKSKELDDFRKYIEKIKEWSPDQNYSVNSAKCQRCIYCNLCDKTNEENVYEKGY